MKFINEKEKSTQREDKVSSQKQRKHVGTMRLSHEPRHVNFFAYLPMEPLRRPSAARYKEAKKVSLSQMLSKVEEVP